MKRAIRYGVLAAFLITLAGTVKADPVIFSYYLTGPDITASFTLPELPTVNDYMEDFAFGVVPTGLVVNGASYSAELYFYNLSPTIAGVTYPDAGGGFGGGPVPMLGVPPMGPFTQLYTGDESAPEMITGTFALTDFLTETESYTLQVTEVTTPEPATLLLFGTGLMGLILMRKRFAVN